MQEDNGVIERLTSMPLYDHFVPDWRISKENKIYKMWTRPTIPWKLECEASKPRSLALDVIIGEEYEDDELWNVNDLI